MGYDSLDGTSVRERAGPTINLSCLATDIEALISRWNSVIQSKGDYFEGL